MSGVQDSLIDEIVDAVVVIDAVHHEVHEHEMFGASVFDNGVADDAFLHVLFKPRGESAHIAFSAACGGDAYVRLSEAPTISDNGVLMQERNLHRVVVAGVRRDTAKAVVYSGPTVTDEGLVIFEGLMPGGTKQGSPGGTARSNVEWVLSGDYDYLVSLQNIAGAAKPASILIQWYAH